MTFEDKVIQKQSDRSLSLTQKVGLETAETNAETQRDFNYKYLFGDGTHLGINNIVALYYQELHIGVGRSSSTPNLRLNSTASWTNRFAQAVKLEGDSGISSPPSDAIYPDPDYGTVKEGVGQDTININSSWFNNNGDNGNLTGGLVQTINSFKNNSLGNPASDNSDKRGSFSSESAAIAHRDATRGTGLYGKRTENSEVYEDPPLNPDPDTEYWYVGQNGIDTPNYYSNPEKGNFLSGISNLISILGPSEAYQLKLSEISTEVQNISSGANVLFDESDMRLDTDLQTQLLSDDSDIATYTSGLNSKIGNDSDSLPTNTLWAYYNWFNSATGAEGTFNTNLNNLTSLVNSLISDIQTRSGSVPAKLGSISSGLKKWRFFWSKENIEKPVSPLISLNGIAGAKTKNLSAIQNANNTLEIIFPNEEEKWIPQPTLFAAFYNPVRDRETFEILSHKNDLVWQGQPHSSEYEIYRKELQDVAEFENNWGAGDLLTTTSVVNPKSGFLLTTYSDSTVVPEKTYTYRVRSRDTANDPFVSPTGSLQSKIYNQESEVDVVSVINGEVTFSEQHSLNLNQFIYFPEAGVYQVTFVGNVTIKVDDATLNIATPSVCYVVPSVVRVPPLPE